MTTVSEPEPHRLAKYRRHLEDLDRAEATITTYLDVLLRMDRELTYGLAHANADELREWIEGDGTRSRATRELYRIIARGFGTWVTVDADEADRLDFNAAVELKGVRVKKRQPRPITDETLRDILARAAEPFRTWYLIAAYLGARCVEIARLDRDDITREYAVLRGKGDKERVVPTHPVLWTAVQALPPGPVAVDQFGARTDRQAVQRRGNRHLHRALRHRDVTMHRLRHWFGTAAYEASGNDILAVQALLGHEQLATTLGYVAHSEAGRRRAVAGLPVLVPTGSGDDGCEPTRAAA